MEKKVDNIFTRMVFREDGTTTLFGWACALAASILMAAVLASMSGCVNIYTRCPFTEKRITRTYQSTGDAYSLSIVVAWPQIMSDDPGKTGFMVENLISIPLGCIGICDSACEAVIDTVCLPADWILSENRKEESK